MENQGSLSLMSMKDCSPMVAFAVYVIVSGITLYMTRNNLKRNGDDDLYSLYTWHELKYIIVMGVVLYGLCQYKQENLAWVSLTIPLLYLVLKNMYVFIHVFTSQQKSVVSKEVPSEDVKKDMKRKLHQELLKSEYNENKSVNLILKRGQISLHDVYLVHGSDANSSSKSRRGMTMRFMPTTSVFDHNLAKEKYNNLNVSKYSNRKIYLARGCDKSKKNDLAIVNF